jgi:hypothetical protein
MVGARSEQFFFRSFCNKHLSVKNKLDFILDLVLSL